MLEQLGYDGWHVEGAGGITHADLTYFLGGITHADLTYFLSSLEVLRKQAVVLLDCKTPVL